MSPTYLYCALCKRRITGHLMKHIRAEHPLIAELSIRVHEQNRQRIKELER